MNIDHLQRFHHDANGVHEDPNGEYLWYQDVFEAIQADEKERAGCVEKLRSIFESADIPDKAWRGAFKYVAKQLGLKVNMNHCSEATFDVLKAINELKKRAHQTEDSIKCDKCGMPAVVNVGTFNFCEKHAPARETEPECNCADWGMMGHTQECNVTKYHKARETERDGL